MNSHSKGVFFDTFPKYEIADQITFQLKRRLKDRKCPQVLRIVGLPACGKTTLAFEVKSLLIKDEVSCEIYEDTHAIAFSREKRAKHALSGIDYEIFNRRSMLKNLRKLIEGNKVKVNIYSHSGGIPTNKTRVLIPADVMILPGFAWQHGLFRHILEDNSLTISLLPKNAEIWRELSIHRDMAERGYLEDDAIRRFSEIKNTYLQHATDLSTEEIDNYFLVTSKDEKRGKGDQYLYAMGNKNSWPHLNLDSEKRKVVFLAYQFKDRELAKGLRLLLQNNGFTPLDGENLPERISKGILKRIKQSSSFIAIITKRDELSDGGYTTSSWLLEEKGAALMVNKTVILMVEQGVNDHYIGYLQSDSQRIHFDRNSFANKMWDVINQLKYDEESEG